MTALLVLAAIGSMLLHEAAHGMAATLLGDPVPGRFGRATWNPLAHVDPIATLALPLILGWCTGWRVVVGAARPMPIGWNHLTRRRQLVVILAGPATNAFFACAWAAVSSLDDPMVRIQGMLVLVNLLPLPPLDGWRLVQWTRRTL